MAHTNNWTSTGLIRKFTGDVKAEEILKSNFESHENPDFLTIKYVINDFSDVGKILLGTEHTKIFASTDDIISNTKGKMKIAIVANRDEHIALANSYRNELKNYYFNCEIFQNLADAEKWANLDNLP